MISAGYTRANNAKLWRVLGNNLLGETALRLPQTFWSVWAARHLGRAEYGTWTGILLALQLIPYVFTLPIYGLDVHYSQLIGAGEPDRARRVAGVALISTAIAAAVCVVGLSSGIAFPALRSIVAPGTSASQFGILLLLLMLYAGQAFTVTHLRNRLCFNLVNRSLFISNIAGTVALVLVVESGGVTGAMLTYAGTLAMNLALAGPSIDISEPGDWRELRTLAATGFGILAGGLAFDSVRLVGRLFVAQQLGISALGAFGVAYVFAGGVVLAGTSSARVLIQFASRAVGARQDGAITLTIVPSVAVAAAGGVAVLFADTAARELIPWWAPQQTEALVIIAPILLGGWALGLSYVFVTHLRAQKRFLEVFVVASLILGAHACTLALLGWWRSAVQWYGVAEAGAFIALAAVFASKLASMEKAKCIFLKSLLFSAIVLITTLILGHAIRRVLLPNRLACFLATASLDLAAGGVMVALAVRDVRRLSAAAHHIDGQIAVG